MNPVKEKKADITWSTIAVAILVILTILVVAWVFISKIKSGGETLTKCGFGLGECLSEQECQIKGGTQGYGDCPADQICCFFGNASEKK